MEKEQLAALAETRALKTFVFALIGAMSAAQRSETLRYMRALLEKESADPISDAAEPIIQEILRSLG